MNLVQLDGDNVIVNPICLHINEFKVLWDLDKTVGKTKVKRWYCFINAFCDPYSPYHNLLEMEKVETICYDMGFDVKDYGTPQFQKAIQKYRSLYISDEERMMIAGKTAYTKLIDKVENIDFDATDENGKPIDTPATLTAAFKNIHAYQDLLNSIEQGISIKKNKNKAVGGTTVGLFEEAKEIKQQEHIQEDFDTSDLKDDEDNEDLEPPTY